MSLLAAVVPIVIYLVFIWRYDRFDREPIGLYLKNFLWGAIGAVILAIIGSLIASSIVKTVMRNSFFLEHVDVIAIAPLVEEAVKGVFLFSTVTNKKFDNMTDGIVYGGAIGLGFGMTENFFYFVTNDSNPFTWFTIVIIRTFFTAAMHCVSTATFGAFLGYAKFKGWGFKITFPIIGYLVAVFIHSAWNFSVSFSSTSLIGFLFLTGSVIIFLSAFSLSLKNEAKMIAKELDEEARDGYFPREFVAIMNKKERELPGWIDERIRNQFIISSTTLAFRKMQYKASTGFYKKYYEQEISIHRNKIAELLNSIRPETLQNDN